MMILRLCPPPPWGPFMQVKIVSEMRALGKGGGGFYVPSYR